MQRGRPAVANRNESTLTRCVNAVFAFVRMAEFEILFFLFFVIAFIIFKDLQLKLAWQLELERVEVEIDSMEALELVGGQFGGLSRDLLLSSIHELIWEVTVSWTAQGNNLRADFLAKMVSAFRGHGLIGNGVEITDHSYAVSTTFFGEIPSFRPPKR
ncbi:hypothetical protein Scep_027244 [Stephania cephalantha]|uniref:RNase H type-1 domain-containing protein n=1 Tax=Stephania cephalantha TaxID=152367 RepID=A0AAP0EB06_9MAGN